MMHAHLLRPEGVLGRAFQQRAFSTCMGCPYLFSCLVHFRPGWSSWENVARILSSNPLDVIVLEQVSKLRCETSSTIKRD